ncbi:papain fold toxin 1 (glutamine deamidase) of polymorphic toxin system [Kitasatospora sp. SolWspMP-SS2h]|nr:papain fold toxin 1 (glutamine deamidase) of polymorphic toxin system [Kitasatospora sp. SolWspMP-SS2h]
MADRGYERVAPDSKTATDLVDYLGGAPKLHPPMSNSLLQKINPHQAPVEPGAGFRPGDDLMACLENVEAYRDTHFGRPRVSGRTLNGTVEPVPGNALWKRHDGPALYGQGPDAVAKLMDQVRAGGPGTFATVLGAGPRGDGHAVALVHDRDGTLRWADPTDRKVTTANGAVPENYHPDWTIWASVADPHENNISGPHDPGFMDRFSSLNQAGTTASDGIGVSHRNPEVVFLDEMFPPPPRPIEPHRSFRANYLGSRRHQLLQQEERRVHDQMLQQREEWEIRARSLTEWVTELEGGRLDGDVAQIGPAGDPHFSFDRATGRVTFHKEPGFIRSAYPRLADVARDFVVTNLQIREDAFADEHSLVSGTEFMRFYAETRPGNQYYDQQRQRDEDLDRDADNLANQTLPEQPDRARVDTLLAVDTPPEGDLAARHQAQALLQDHPGFVLGETHGDTATWHFLRDNMQQLREARVTTLYVEHFSDDTTQHLFDRYNSEPPDALTGNPLREIVIRQAGNRMPPETILEVVEAAHRQGIEIRAIDGNPARRVRSEHNDPNHPDVGYFRVRRMNAYSYEAIRNHRGDATGDEKYIVVVGSSHAGNYTGPEGRPDVRGMSQTLGIPGVRFIRQQDQVGARRTVVSLPPRMEQTPE